jgi:hypothetical protein
MIPCIPMDCLTLGQTSMSIFPRSIAMSHPRQGTISLILDLRFHWSHLHCFVVSDKFMPFGQSGKSIYIIAASVTCRASSVLPQGASVSPVDIEAVGSGETPDFGPDFPVRPLDHMDADQSPDFGPSFETVRADFTVEQSDAEQMPDFGPDFDGDIEMTVEPTSHSEKSLGNFLKYVLPC